MKTLELHFDERGEGEPLLILHGLYGSNNNWQPHARWLAEHFRVISPDLRNHGRSPHGRPMDYPALAADVVALLDRLGLERAIWLGHSMGGKTAMTAALTAPARVAALVAVDIAPVRYPPSHQQIVDALRALPLASLSSRAEADQQLAAAVAEPPVRQFLLTNLEQRDGEFRWRIPLEILDEALPAIEGFPELGGRYEGPALFIHGADSDYLLPEQYPAVREHFPHSEFARLENAGHWLHVEQPEPFAQKLREFLS